MPDREPTYADEPTAQDAGHILGRLRDRVSVRPPYRLTVRVALEAPGEEFGGRFLPGLPGWRGIDPAVLAAFARRVRGVADDDVIGRPQLTPDRERLLDEVLENSRNEP